MRVLENLRHAGCRTAWLNGSFVCEVQSPHDFDLCWDPIGVVGANLDPVILDTAPPRFAQKVKYGGDILPNVVEADSRLLFVDFFQVDKSSGLPKGVIEIDLTTLPKSAP